MTIGYSLKNPGEDPTWAECARLVSMLACAWQSNPTAAGQETIDATTDLIDYFALHDKWTRMNIASNLAHMAARLACVAAESLAGDDADPTERAEVLDQVVQLTLGLPK